MSLVIVKEHDLAIDHRVTARQSTGWLQRLNQWFSAQYRLRRQWDHSGIMSSGRRVPYRVWRRHGAYLDMQRQVRKH